MIVLFDFFLIALPLMMIIIIIILIIIMLIIIIVIIMMVIVIIITEKIRVEFFTNLCTHVYVKKCKVF